MGALFQASQITIWTDVDGVYSADPRKVPEAVCLPSLSYHEAWELSYFGANVLHPRTTLPAMRYSIPIAIRNFFNLAAPGGLISCKASCWCVCAFCVSVFNPFSSHFCFWAWVWVWVWAWAWAWAWVWVCAWAWVCVEAAWKMLSAISYTWPVSGSPKGCDSS